MRSVKKWPIVVALLVFVATAALAIVVNSTLLGHGFHLEYSISRYVGLETWSAVSFALGNCVVAALLGMYVWRLGEAWGMPRVFYYLIVMMVVGLLALSFCPSGYCDEPGQKSLVTWVHEISSRTMFAAMAAEAVIIASWKRVNNQVRALCIGYILYAGLCIVGYLTRAGWFLPLLMIYETLYLVSFMLLAMVASNKSD